jgi:hypothetical protein
MAADFLPRLGESASSFTSPWDADVSSAFAFPRNFLTARLRGDFGSIAMAPNPLTHTPNEICNLVAYFETRCKQNLL